MRRANRVLTHETGPCILKTLAPLYSVGATAQDFRFLGSEQLEFIAERFNQTPIAHWMSLVLLARRVRLAQA
jgi:hypothetical protein